MYSPSRVHVVLVLAGEVAHQAAEHRAPLRALPLRPRGAHAGLRLHRDQRCRAQLVARAGRRPRYFTELRREGSAHRAAAPRRHRHVRRT